MALDADLAVPPARPGWPRCCRTSSPPRRTRPISAPARCASIADSSPTSSPAPLAWCHARPDLEPLPLERSDASTGSAATLQAAARSWSPRWWSAAAGLTWPVTRCPHVQTPVLLIVGGQDSTVLDLNRTAAAHLLAPHELLVVPGATHLFDV